MAVAWHVNVRLGSSAVLAPGDAERRRFVRSVGRVLEPYGLLAFGLAPDHAHFLLACDRAEAGRGAQAVECSLQWHLRPGGGFREAWFQPVETQSHLRRGFFYVLRNDRDPRKRWTNVPELLGLRFAATGTVGRVRELLPELGRGDFLRELNVNALSNPVGGHRLRQAAVEAICGPLRTKRPAAVALRRAAATVGVRLGMTRAAVAEQLELSPRSMPRTLMEAEPAMVRAIEGQVALLDGLDQQRSA